MPLIKPVLKLSPVAVDAALPADPTLRVLVDDVIAKARYAFAVAASGDSPATAGRLDTLFAEYLRSRSPSTRARNEELGKAMLDAPTALRTTTFGRYAHLDPKEYRAVGSDGVRKMATVPTIKISADAVKKSLRALDVHLGSIGPIVIKPKPSNPDLTAGLAFKKMKLFITHVHCTEETDGVFEGSDEIAMGGATTDPFGNTLAVSEFKVSNDFDEGETTEFGMSKVFASWDLATDPIGFPYVYGAVIALGEKDDGGFWKFLQELWKKIEEEVTAAVAAATGAAIGAAIGLEFGGVGVIVGAVVGALIGWLISAFDNGDDIIGARAVTMTLAAATKSYYDWAELTTAEGWRTTLKFKGDGGRYEVGVAYRVFLK